MKLLSRGEKGFTLVEILVVVAILGALAAIAIPNVIQFMNEGKEEANQTEQHNVQTAVLALLADAEVHQLNGDYADIQELADVQGVTAGTAPSNHSLDEYLMEGTYPLRQAYDINIDGLVTVHSD